LALADDPEGEVRRAVAQRLPTALLPRLLGDPDWRVRWEVAQRAAPAALAPLLNDDDPEVRAAARQRLPLAPAPQAGPSTHRSNAHG
jgi:HEAT repeat protein